MDKDIEKESPDHPANKIYLEKRPEILDLIEKASSLMCTDHEISVMVGISEDCLKAPHNHELFLRHKDLGQMQGKGSLRRKQFHSAIDKDNVTMQIWLGKQWLGQGEQEQLALKKRELDIKEEELRFKMSQENDMVVVVNRVLGNDPID